jgi:polysaccharide pyruvyl transferase WcaK-like protein
MREQPNSCVMGYSSTATVWVNSASSGYKAKNKMPGAKPRIALLTPYSGGNLGDAAIQDAIIGNLRQRSPEAEFYGVSLNCENFLERHGAGAFPLCAVDGTFYRSSGSKPAMEGNGMGDHHGDNKTWAGQIKGMLKRLPLLLVVLQKSRQRMRRMGQIPAKWGHWALNFSKEIRHWIRGYRFLRTQDILIVSGGGQLCDRWGGAWGHPFALFKWAVLARIARIPFVVASVGANEDATPFSRLLMALALRLAHCRSYRDENSRGNATGLLAKAARDPIVPDVAFSLPNLELPQPAGIRALACGRTIIAVSPIAFAKPGCWPKEDRALHQRYVQQMTGLLCRLFEHGYFVVLVLSSLGDDESVLPELLNSLDPEARKKLPEQMHIPAIKAWQDLVSSLRDVDFLIASRLHSTILGFVSHKPTIAISFDAKVDSVMSDLSQTDFLFQIHDFTAQQVFDAVQRLELRQHGVIEQIASYQQRILPLLASQYDALAQLALAGCHRRSAA